MCECISCRSGLFAYLARAPFHFSNSHAPTLNLPPTNYCYCCEIFSLKRLVWPVILGDYWFEQAFIYHRFGIASHRSVSVSLRIELPSQPPTPLSCLTGHCLSIIMLSVICFHAPLKHFQFHSRAKQPKAPQRVSSQLVLHYLNYDSIKFQSKINELPISRTHTRTHLYTCILGLCNAVFVAYVAQFACVS